MKLLINLLVMISLLLIVGCTANKAVVNEEERVKTPQEIAIEAISAAEMAFEENDFPYSIEKYNEALSYYIQILPTAAPEDSIPRLVFNLKKNIANIHVKYAVDVSGENDFLDAITSYETAISILKELEPVATPADGISDLLVSVYKKTAIASRQNNDYVKAIEYFDLYLASNPEDSADILLEQFDIYKNNLGDENRAFTVLEEYANSNNNYDAYYSLGKKYSEKKDFDKAVLWFEKAYNVKSDANVLKELGSIYHDKIRNWNKSNLYLEEFIKTNPNRDDLNAAYILLGDNYNKLDNKAKSTEYFEKSIALEYDEQIALSICSYYDKMKNNSKTITWANMILENNPNKVEALLFRGIAKYNIKDNKGAKADFERIKDDQRYGSYAQQYLKLLK